jgi:aminodeoxyfutalosine deaminase
MIRFRADYLLPIVTPPRRRAWVGVENGRVVALGEGDEDAVDLGRVAVLPGLVNAHTHLELSYLAGRVPPTRSFGEWVRAVMALRRPEGEGPGGERPEGEEGSADAGQVTAAARAALQSAKAAGTALFGEVSNSLSVVPVLRDAGVSAQVFYELTGFTEPDPEQRVALARRRLDALGATDTVRLSLAPHAPYSVSGALFQALSRDLDAHPGSVSTVHVGEHEAEVALLRDGSGDMRALLQELGRWPSDWVPPGCSPVAYLDRLGVLDGRLLAVHGVQCTHEDLARLGARGTTLVTCPRSNRHVGAGAPPLEACFALGVDVALGTDSLASAPDLNLFSELAETRTLTPRVPAGQLLRSATLVGARALGFHDDYGSIEAGKRAALIAVSLPAGVSDVEEYLVGGVAPEQIRWLEV